MALTGNLYVRAAIDFTHDIAAGLFPGGVIAAWMIRQRFESASPDAVGALETASTSLWLILLGALLALVITGALRLKYWRLNVRSGFMEAKKRMVLVKHTAFVLVLVASIAAMFTLLPG